MENTMLNALRADENIISEQWLDRLLDAKKLAQLAKVMGLGWHSEEDIIGLWKIGLLRADLISSDIEIGIEQILPHSKLTHNGDFIYIDARSVKHQHQGYGSSLEKITIDVSRMEIKFHPYRLYIIHHLQRTFKIDIPATQYLLWEEGVSNIAQRGIDSLKHWTSSTEFPSRFDYWNNICETAITADPFTFSTVNTFAEPPTIPSTPDTDYERRTRIYLVKLGEQKIRQMREDLAFAANSLDENRTVHVLLRLMKPRERSKIKGPLGGALHFLAMAETIRRAAEGAFGHEFPEEDEIGPGQWFSGARKRLYGSDRVFDAPRRHLRDYLTLLGLDFGVKVRCYVEGATEYGALDHAVGDLGHVQLIDLKGKFAEKGGKGLAFSESLEADKLAGVFSVILLDGDRIEYIRLVRRAAEDERFYGGFFVANPDIECANFGPDELIDIACSIGHLHATESKEAADLKTTLSKNQTKITGNNALFSILATHGLSDVRKDKHWGKALMAHAIKHPLFNSAHQKSGEKRPIVEAVELILRIQDVGFRRSLGSERVDPTTGRPIQRGPHDSP